MKVLVVSKKTNLELHGETIRKRVQAGLIHPDYFHLLETTHKEHYETLEALVDLLTKAQIPYSTISRGLYWPDLNEFSTVITVGGDGTLLEASHHIVNNKMILVGVRSAKSSVGKLCYAKTETLELLIKNLKKGTLNPLKVARLQAEVASTESGSTVLSKPVLNDFLYTNLALAATTRYKITLGTHMEGHRSSGVWVSTPCGSTAAILAAGGKSMDLKSRNFQYAVRELYDFNPASAHSLAQGEFDPDSDTFRIENLNEKAVLACDGLHGTVPLGFGDVVTFLRGPDLSLAPPDFYGK